jgi:hypothetical protein
MNVDDLQCFPSAFIRIQWGHPLDSHRKDYEMRKGFTRKPQRDEPATPVKNYITRSGLQRLKDELRFLLTRERPAVTEVVAWAASNGDRSENADYQYGKRRLRQIDGWIRFLTKRIEAAEGQFKFIRWQGRPESIRQNSLFKDFYEMAEHEIHKGRYMYVLGTEHAVRFLSGGRSMSSVLSRNKALRKKFTEKFGIATARCATTTFREGNLW